MATPGMAAADAPDAQPEALEKTMLLKGLHRIVGTGGGKAAFRTQPGRNDPLVDPDKTYKGKRQYFKQGFHASHPVFFPAFPGTDPWQF